MKTQRDPMTHEVLRQIPYGLYVVGVRGNADGATNWLAASWVTQCSFEPPLLMVAIRRPSHSYELVKTGKAFSLNLLDRKELPIVRLLERPAHLAGDKNSEVDYTEADTGAPILRDAFAYVECEIRSIYEPGDHALVIGEVVNAELREPGAPLMCADLKWHYGG